ncbi:hypothetical protein DXG03_003027 [Asterophora parasitica]|uniref:Uncharacterized protein n=1 Tax=Asterophora parasitica TaxID=117018 RepID=A0A9P7G7W1_9AGAR|nr:hypothetical protein DXG03_003027 [Asterophora parasitica]
MTHPSRPSFTLNGTLSSPAESVVCSARSSLTINDTLPADTTFPLARSSNHALSISAGPTLTLESSPPSEYQLDIEHTPVQDDPREWSSLRKNVSLTLISFASLISGLAGTIQNRELHPFGLFK